MDYKELYELWLTNPYFDEDTRKELEAIKDDNKEIEDRFYKDLEFGTAGLRGVIGAGTNRMNIYTVRRATQGLANYIIKMNGQDKGVAIAFDSRHMSPEFADEAALCLNANGIKAYVFDSLRPTPELSFAVRELKCIAGINVTASHITHLSTMDTKYTGKMVLRLHHLTMLTLRMQFLQLQIMLMQRQWIRTKLLRLVFMFRLEKTLMTNILQH